jgi:hypothetical protein
VLIVDSLLDFAWSGNFFRPQRHIVAAQNGQRQPFAQRSGANRLHAVLGGGYFSSIACRCSCFWQFL